MVFNISSAAAAAATHLNLTLFRSGKFSHRLFVHANEFIARVYARACHCRPLRARAEETLKR